MNVIILESILCSFPAYQMTVHVPDNQTFCTITGLEPGTKYGIYVETIFNVSGTVSFLTSWELLVTTSGFGPENREFGCSIVSPLFL
jgi:hypothetical protein